MKYASACDDPESTPQKPVSVVGSRGVVFEVWILRCDFSCVVFGFQGVVFDMWFLRLGLTVYFCGSGFVVSVLWFGSLGWFCGLVFWFGSAFGSAIRFCLDHRTVHSTSTCRRRRHRKTTGVNFRVLTRECFIAYRRRMQNVTAPRLPTWFPTVL